MTSYSQLFPTSDLVSYTTPSPTVEYTPCNVVSTFGPVFTPKVYASELDVLELASSGKIAISLKDSHAFDIVDRTSNVISFTARDSNSFLFETGQGASLSLAGSNALLTTAGTTGLAAGGDIAIATSNSWASTAAVDFRLLCAHDGWVAASNVLHISACNNLDVKAENGASFTTASGPLSLQSMAGGVSIDAAGTLDVDAGALAVDVAGASVVNSGTLSATTSSYLSLASGSSASLTSAGSTHLVSGSNLTFTSSNDTGVSAGGTATITSTSNLLMNSLSGNASLAAPLGDILVSAPTGKVTIDGELVLTKPIKGVSSLVSDSNITIAAGSNISASAGDSFAIAASNAVSLDAVSGPASLSSASNDVSLNAGDDIYITALKNVYVTGTQQSVRTNAGMNIMGFADHDIFYVARGDLTATACNQVAVAAAAGPATLSSRDGDAFVTAGMLATVSGSNGVSISSAAGGIVATSASNISMTAGGTALISSTSSATVQASDATISSTSGDITITSVAGLSAQSASNASIASTAGSLTMSAGTSASVSALSGLASVTGTSAGAVVSARLEAAGTSNVAHVRAPDSGMQVFSIGSHDVIKVYKTALYDPSDSNGSTGYKVKVDADFEIAGAVNSIGLTQTNLNIEDKTISLAYSADQTTVVDGTANTGAGVRVEGFPAGASNVAQYPNRYNKSIVWNNGTGGMLDLKKKDAAATESFWDVQGGSMRWTHVDEATGKEVSFILRINENEEFEMVKRSQPLNGPETFVKVAKFGRVF